MTQQLRQEPFDPRTFPLQPWWFVRPEGIHDLDVARLRSEAARAREAEAWRLLEEII